MSKKTPTHPTGDPDESERSSTTRPADVDLQEARLRQQAIGAKLRHLFDEVINEPVPSEFLDILKRADERHGGGA
jgi:hypothetical protein